MAYNKTVWVDGPEGGTPVNATNLNNIENGIETLDTASPVWIVKGFVNDGETVAASDRVFVDTTGGAFSLNLPASPIQGDTVKFVDVSNSIGTNNFTIWADVADSLMGLTTPNNFLTLTQNNDFVELTFSTTSGWVITGKP